MSSFGETLRAILHGEKSDTEITDFLTIYNDDALTADHVRIGVEVMRENMTPVHIDGAIDIVGTGGTRLHTLSISTARADKRAGRRDRERMQPRAACADNIYRAVNMDGRHILCLLYTSPSPRDLSTSRMPSSA